MEVPAPEDLVTVAVITRRRPAELARLIRRLGDQELADDLRLVGALLIVDNDPPGSAKEAIAEAPSSLPFRYVRHARRGLSTARNLAVELAETPWLAFLDDDETPEAGWLLELLATAKATGAPIVGGPVLARFISEPPSWAIEGGFFDHTRPVASRSPTDVVGAGNLLLHRGLTASMGTLFDPAFDRLGGEDSHFCHRARRLGHQVVWTNDSVVREWITPARVRPKFLLKRGFRIGCVQTTRDVALLSVDRSVGRLRLRRLRAGATEILRGTLDAAKAARGEGRVGLIKAAVRAAHGLGMAAGAAGVRFRHY